MAKNKRKKVDSNSDVSKRVAEMEKNSEELALTFISHPKINKLVGPYMVALGDTNQAMCWLKILASMLLLEKDVREDCVSKVFKEEADFLLMYCDAIDAIIKEEIKNL